MLCLKTICNFVTVYTFILCKTHQMKAESALNYIITTMFPTV